MTELSDSAQPGRQTGAHGHDEELVRALLNATGQGIYGVDLEGDCTFANPACVTMLGYGSDQELLGKNMHAFIHHTRPSGEPYPVEECRIYQAFIEGEGTHAGDEIVWRADGTSFPAEYWSYPLFLHSELAGCVVAFVDITERKRAEEELRQREKLSALGKLSAGLAHELNNPAAAAQRAASQIRDQLEELETLSVRLSQQGLDDTSWAHLYEAQQSLAAGRDAGELSALERADREDAVASWLDSHGVDDAWQIAPGLVAAGIEDSALDTLANELPAAALADALRWMSQSQAIRDLVGTIATSARSISDLVGAVKEHSYMDRAPQQEVNVRDGLESTLRILGHKLKQGVNLVRDFDPELPRIVVLAGELNQVWINLIDNAIDAAGPDGEIRIRTFRENDRIVVEVADNGGGIPPHIQSRIFDPFFTTKDVGQGTGLGLDVARRIVTERCGGEIDFRSEPGDTRFWVSLPLRPPNEHHAGPRPPGPAPTEE
jgi:PAS domain S-box-containing protein